MINIQRVKSFDATGIAPNGFLYSGDLNAIQDAAAALTDLTQTVSVSALAVGETGLQLMHYGSGEARMSGAMRTDGIFRGLGGLYAGAFTTTQRNAIALGSRPYGLTILNSTTNQLEWNSNTDPSPTWYPIASNGAGYVSAPNGVIFNDTTLQRTAAGTLQLGAASPGGTLLLGSSTQPGLIALYGQSSSGVRLETFNGTDTQPRFALTTDGTHNWGGGGSSATDTALARASAGILTVTNTLNVISGYQVGGTALAASHLSNGVIGSGAVVLAGSPTLTGTPIAPTATAGTNTGQIATTQFVQSAIGGIGGSPVTSVFGRSGAVVAQTGDYSAAQVTGAAVDANVVHLANAETITGVKLFNVGALYGSQTVAATATLVNPSAPIVLTDTTTAAFTLNLPAAPTAGQIYSVIDDKGQWGTHNLTIGRNGKNINGVGANLILSQNYGRVNLYYDGTAWNSSINVQTPADLSSTAGQFFAGSIVSAMGGSAAATAFSAVGAVAGAALNNTGALQVSRATGNNVFTVTQPGDATNWRWTMDAAGKMSWGAPPAAPDTNLYRNSASQLKTDSLFVAATGFLSQQTSGSYAYQNYLLATDAQPAFSISGSGTLGWGAGGTAAIDTNLYRAGGVLKTDNAFQSANVGIGSAPGGVGANTGTGIYSGFAIISNGAGGGILYGTVPGDSQYRFYLTSDGLHNWGSGSSGVDLQVKRNSSNALGVVGLTAPTAYIVLGGTGGYGLIESSGGGLFIENSGGKLGFFGNSPIARPAPGVAIGSIARMGGGAGAFTDQQYAGSVGTSYYTVGDIVTCLKNLGLITM